MRLRTGSVGCLHEKKGAGMIDEFSHHVSHGGSREEWRSERVDPNVVHSELAVAPIAKRTCV